MIVFFINLRDILLLKFIKNLTLLTLHCTRRKNRLIESNAKCRHLKKLTCKVKELYGNCLSV
jgi:hypothetical protein